MNPEARPNIVTVGALGIPASQLFVWVWNGMVVPSFPKFPLLGGMEGAAVASFMTLGFQYLDRLSKRASDHVLTKYGSDNENGVT